MFTFFHSPFSSLRSSILFLLSHVHHFPTFISLFLPIHYLLIGVISCVHSCFISSCPSLFLSFHSFNRPHFHPLLYKFSAFSRFFPSFLLLLILSSLPLFHAFVFLYLLTLGRLYSHFPSPLRISNPSLLRTDRRHDQVMRSAGKCIVSASDMGKGPEPLSTSQVPPSLQKFVLLLE